MAALWTFEAQRPGSSKLVCSVPQHRLGDEQAKQLVRALIMHLEQLAFEEFIFANLNRRKGGPPAFDIGEAKYFADPDKAKAGYRMDGPTVSVEGWWTLSADACQFLRAEAGLT